MLHNPKYVDRLDRLSDEVRAAPALNADLFARIVADGCIRLPAMITAGKAARLDRMIEAGAWSDAALALLELELPAWRLRRLVYEDGEWFCSLSRQSHLPLALDETADASHEVLSLAILIAFLEARRRSNVVRTAALPSSPRVPATQTLAFCCDNYA
jgi:hypothetical protein